MLQEVTLITEDFYELARASLDTGDFFGFVEGLSKAELLAQDDPKAMADIYFLKVRGLMKFSHYQRVIQVSPRALEYLDGEKRFRVRNWEGVSHANLGYIKMAESIFLQVLSQAGEEKKILFETYLNLVWLYLTIDRENFSDKSLVKAKKYLDLASRGFEGASDQSKWRFCQNLSTYYFHVGQFDAAKEVLEESIGYSQERELPQVYTNLAEIYLKLGDVSEKFFGYCRDAETIGIKYDDYLSIGNSKSAMAMFELSENRVISCIDYLYQALENYRKSEAYAHAFECLEKVTKITSDYKIERMMSIGKALDREFDCTAYRERFQERRENQ